MISFGSFRVRSLFRLIATAASEVIFGDLGFRLYFCRLLAREGINAEQLARDLKSFELKVMDERVE